jgi:tripartite-type tricarboxylate transporter receptor subunit TctC
MRKSRLLLAWRFSVATVLLAVGTSTMVRAAETVEDFYKGRQIRLIVGTSSGGLYDEYARLMAHYWGRYIPGQPTIVVQNMPGAAGLSAANFVANSAPRDGSVIAAVQSNVPTADTLRMAGARFKGVDLSWVGSISEETFVGFVFRTSPIQSLDDTLTREAVFGGPSLGSASIDMAVIARKLFGFKLKVVSGYPSGSDSKLAMDKGEIDGTFATGWSAVKTDEPDWIRDHTIRILVQHGLTRNRELPDVPLLLDWAKTAEDRQLLQILMARTAFAKPYFMPPGVPADRLTAIRRAFDQTVKDKDFIADADKMHVDPNGPMTGEEVATTISKLSETPPSVIDRINEIFADYEAGK